MAWHETWNEPPPRRRGFFSDRGGFFPPGVKVILLLTVGVFVLEMFWAGPLFAVGSLSLRGLMRLQLWRLVTYMFLHGSTNHILINMFVFWMLGVSFERQVGTRRFLWIYFGTGIAGGLFEAAFNFLMYLKHGAVALDAAGHTFLTMEAVGASAGVAGILVAFATLNPRAIFLLFFVFPIEARWVAIIYALVETRHIVGGLTKGWTDNVAHAAHFGGMALGFVWMKFGDHVAAWRRYHRGSARSQHTSQGRGREAKDEAKEEAEVDRILKKIHEEGIDSLTPREKMFLQDTSRRRGGRF
ncbi:MAG TPA: rhomboid family intramembrane serine protease [Phycisphaerae bacterium]|nr:rhomboid family intramembrane serine protease [Phycisphaerae bacterium]